jgi:hypothetical protein
VWGSSVAIVLNSISTDSLHCLLFRADAEDGASHLIQAGLVKCGSGLAGIGLDGACSLSNNLVRFVETENASGFHCFPHGGVSTGVEHDAAVQAYSGNSWTSWIDGTYYESNTQSHLFIAAGAEHNGNSDCSGWSASATFGSSAYPWQRLRPDRATWYTVQSAWTNADCWSTSGGPPGAFTVSH